MKTSKQVEKHLKGVANHWRIDILFLVARSRELGVENIARRVGGNFKTISAHTVKLVQAGLLDKKYQGRMILHSLSPYGKIMVKFLNEFKEL